MHDLSKIRQSLHRAITLFKVTSPVHGALAVGANAEERLNATALIAAAETSLEQVWKLNDVAFYKVVHVQFRDLMGCLDLLGFIDSIEQSMGGGLAQIANKSRRRQRWYRRYGEIDSSEMKEIARLRHFE